MTLMNMMKTIKRHQSADDDDDDKEGDDDDNDDEGADAIKDICQQTTLCKSSPWPCWLHLYLARRKTG